MLEKIYTGTRDQGAQDILDLYQTQGYCVVNYLYFANAMKRRLFEQPRQQKDKDYKLALDTGDFILPDGIALQTFYKYSTSQEQSLRNLNGTDFLPYFLHFLSEQNKKVHLYIYGSKPEYTNKIQDHFVDLGYDVRYATDGYHDLDWSAVITHKDFINILIVGRGTPLQEIWTNQHLDMIKQKGLLVMNQGGTLDFMIGVERRAPDWIVRSRVLETPWRVITNPKKNLGKFLAMFGIFRYFFAKKDSK